MNKNLDKILNLKRAKFLAVVKRICRARRIEEPVVNFDYCEGENENHLAHMHPDTREICVSERQLAKLNFDDIENTAAHEVAHLFEDNHGSKFADELTINQISSFKPGAGTVFISENSSMRVEQPIVRNTKPDKIRCNYHLCRKRVKLYGCKYCKWYFCKKHFEPKPSGMPRFNDNSQEARLFREEYRREDAHPCVPYFDFKEAELKRQADAYGNALDRLSKKTYVSKPKYAESELSQLPISPKKHEQSKKEKVPKKSEEKTIVKEPTRTQQESPKPKPVKLTRKIPIKAILATILLIIIFATIVVYNQDKQVTEQESITVPVTKTIMVDAPVKLSFSEYINNYKNYNTVPITLTGTLQREIKGTEQAGVYVEEIVDDYGNKIELSALTKEQKELFPKTGKTDKVYEVNGTFKVKYQNLYLEANLIIATERPTEKVEQKVTVNETRITYVNRTITKTLIPYKLIQAIKDAINPPPSICEDGTIDGQCSPNQPLYCENEQLVEKPSKCGCPTGKRLYERDCTPIIKCSDGTLHPECSRTMNMQCVNGTFKINAEKCGCPVGMVKRNNNCVPTCNDGTAYGECSKDEPLYCEEGELIKKASTCGCKYDYVVRGNDCISRTIVESQEATDYLNTLREKYGRRPVKWHEDLYNLAVFRSKDMYENHYFDHVTPEGKCVKDFKADYGLGGYTIAENAGAVAYEFNGDYVSYAPYANPKDQIDGWMESRGHRYNLLYEEHVMGVVGCYKGACIFLGANTDPYGLGAGPCTTGDEGLAYWESAGKQPGEI